MDTVRSSRWGDACTAAAVLAVDPTGVGGISLRSAAGPVRDRWLAHCMRLFPRRCHWHRVPINIGDDRLLGGLDLAATLTAGRPVVEQGILAQADGGVLLMSMAERMTAGTAAKVGAVLDRREVVVERDGFARRSRARFAVVALDEGIEADERPPDSLLDRLGLHVELNGVSVSDAVDGAERQHDVACARRTLRQMRVADEVFVALCQVASAFGIGSARAAWFALRVARTLAALGGRTEVSEEDVALAVRLVFAPRAVVAPSDSAPSDAAGGDAERGQESATQPPPPTRQTPATQQTLGQQSDPSSSELQPSDGRTPSHDPLSQSSAGGQLPAHEAESGAERMAPSSNAGSLSDRVLAAATAALPSDFLTQLTAPQARSTRSRQSGQSGRSGTEQISLTHGRPVGTRAGELRPGARVSVIETLRAAAPWQRIRRLAAERAMDGASRDTAEPSSAAVGAAHATVNQTHGTRGRQAPPRIRVLKDDIRLTRFVRHTRCTTIFLVDASGSAALHRLAEVKGAVELMLAESYVRRDRVALISFRGAAARILLPPTNSLVRAKRELAGMPGGGGTPLAIGIDAARVLADSLKRRGESPMVVVLTDGRPNITRDGKGNHKRAEADTVNAARMMRTNSITSLMVDTAPQPRMSTAQFAREMGARYIPLPYADAGALASVISRHANG